MGKLLFWMNIGFALVNVGFVFYAESGVNLVLAIANAAAAGALYAVGGLE